MSIDQLHFVSHDDPEWVSLWGKLEDKQGDTRDFDPETGEVWQYMSTTKHPLGYVHQFRHRNHPEHGRRIICNVVASRGWKPDANGPANMPHYVD